jgi:hypothetical protein
MSLMKAVLNKADEAEKMVCVVTCADMLLCCYCALFVAYSADVFTYLGL